MKMDGWICFGVLEEVGIYPKKILPKKGGKMRIGTWKVVVVVLSVHTEGCGAEAWMVKMRLEGGLDSCDYWCCCLFIVVLVSASSGLAEDRFRPPSS